MTANTTLQSPSEFFRTSLEARFSRNQIISASRRQGLAQPETPSFRVSIPSRFTEDLVMRNDLDFAPLYRSSVGFDRVFNLLNNAQRLQAIDTWPPYDIVKTSDDEYRIEMAVAGFADADLDITQDRNVLIVKGQKEEAKDGEYLHRGIAGRSFERRFELADHVKVEDAALVTGLLRILLKREIPEAMKPRKIAIGTSAGRSAPLQLEADRQVA
jgi:molecular chaperone IbpA